ncbi:LSU ribosomal protein L23P [Abditibacterium utsteinense]|uniref:Large ribosomal subunit protein uL23 n=1 Tax=Abditibacterium utsteinense TaxID=1960156 RepID=A0A2S8ST25_9BACT|nr:50S ribosomal protein L23 [Abditibacterium utsteinense]PQV63945.1 LSU ribosomal protein L23P [Abditibacterium utsteinense]
MSKPLHEILERPVITEKSVKLSQAGRYTFRCKTSANKIEIKAAIETVYEVEVANVNTLIMKGKTKQVGRARKGRTSDYKKAIVTLAPDAKATRLKEIFEGA